MKKHLRAAAALLALLLAGAVAEPAETDLLEVDHKLYELGYRDGACNGVLDDVTVNALCNFQRANGLEVTGTPDGRTVSVLLSGSAISEAEYLSGLAREYADMPVLGEDASGESVLRLQRALKALGYMTGSCDGTFNPETVEAVARFQLANGLEMNGTADGEVFLRLYEGSPIAWEEFLQQSGAAAGDSGAKVHMLQIWLRRKGYFTGECTGSYGEITQKAVRRFQSDCNLTVDGIAGPETCRALYTDVGALMGDAAAIRCGDTGEMAEALCRDLAALNYPAHGRFNMQTELALMQFQHINGLNVTGSADIATLTRLHDGSALAANAEAPALESTPPDEGVQSRVLRRANALLGKHAEFDSAFGFVQYVYFKCGVALMSLEEMQPVALDASAPIAPGSVIGVEANGAEAIGIATEDRALIFCGSSGYVIMRYLDAIQPDRICEYRIAQAQ